ncbi:hypothetical protein ONZ45_g3040 [Pleurotus djamor]|nr:hypothetical protein ONZ45_g19544 [Pleurotus djamor]KAJ8520087.1 hypothetical protein ONZ45_g3040 [Pleurotus djamor]
MAAPADMNTLNISGKFWMNKTLSDDTADILYLQGVGWMTRKIIANASLHLTIKHFKDEEGVEHIDIEQVVAGLTSTVENRVLDWTNRDHHDHVFGHVIGKSRRLKVEEIDDEFLKKDWLSDVVEHGAIESYVESDTPKSGTTWIARQTWGFETINGERRYTRHIHFTGPKGEEKFARLVYDYDGPLDAPAAA